MDQALLTPRNWAYEVAVVAALCVLSVFFLPMAHGPYSAVHGPISALRSWRNRLRLALSMWLAALGGRAAKLLAGLSSASILCIPGFSARAVPPELSAVLRC